MEGFYVPGSVPNRFNNPGDLRHSPHSNHDANDPDGIGHIDTPADGWADLEHQLELDAQRGKTVRELIYSYAPPNENDTERYLAFVCDNMPCSPDTTVAEALRI